MRRLLLSAFLVLSPLAAHADQFDFTLVGDGNTVSFSLPSTATYLNHYHIVYLSYAGTPGTVNGVADVTVYATFYSENLGMNAVGHIDWTHNTLNLFGETPIDETLDLTPVPPYYYPVGGTITNTFDPGVYHVYTLDANYVRTPYTLTVTPGGNTDVTPEPATLVLLATGSLGLLDSLRRRRPV